MGKKPVCLQCKFLMWQGFLGVCVHTEIDDGVFDEAIELAEARIEGKSEKEIAIIEQQQEIKFEKSLASELLAIPYMVWRRKNKEIYYEHAPKTIRECPFGFEALVNQQRPAFLIL